MQTVAEKQIIQNEEIERLASSMQDMDEHDKIKTVLALCLRKTDLEAVRSHYWIKTRLAARMVATQAAKLGKDRANDSLDKFDAFERGRVNVEIERLIVDLKQIQKAMQGGTMPDKLAA